MTTRLLFAADIHLGRGASSLPQDLEDWGLEPGALGAAAAWARAVEEALARGVHAVVLAGDVVDSDNCFFEAFGPLEAGVARLHERGVPVLAVAGNHDAEVLPRLAARLPGLHVIGAEGAWEERLVSPPGRPPVRILGWSFPAPVVRTSPLATLPPRSPGPPVIGVLHCDVDGGDSPYAPVPSSSLAAARGDAWLLGHVHLPTEALPQARRGYLGSLSALDPGELGPRGPWLVEVERDGVAGIRHVPLSPVRWENVPVDLSGLRQPEELDGAMVGALSSLHGRISHQLDAARVVGCRLKLVGTCSFKGALADALSRRDPRSLRRSMGGLLFFVGSVEDLSRRPVDLASLARGSDPPAVLARMLLEIEDGNEEGLGLVREAVAAIAPVAAHQSWFALDALQDLEGEARRQLLVVGRDALEALLVQRGEG